MRKGLVFKIFVYFLSFSFLLLINGFPRMIAEAKEGTLPVGEMVSRGEVKFESKENVWAKVEPFHFPIFQKVKMKTENGAAVIALANNGQIDVGQNSIFSFDQMDQLHLSQGQIDFRIPSNTDLDFRVGNLMVTKSRPLRAGKGSPSISVKSNETIGGISIHSNGSVIIKSIQGSLSILDQDRTVVAALSSGDSVTIPSIMAKSASRVTVAQAGETGRGLPDAKISRTDVGAAGAGVKEAILGPWEWGGIGLAALTLAGVITWAVSTHEEEEERVPICR
jgi:hypothetical protein